MQHQSSHSLAVATLLAPLGTPAWPSPEPPQSCPMTFPRRLLSEKTSHSARVLSKLAGVLAMGSCGGLAGPGPTSLPRPQCHCCLPRGPALVLQDPVPYHTMASRPQSHALKFEVKTVLPQAGWEGNAHSGKQHGAQKGRQEGAPAETRRHGSPVCPSPGFSLERQQILRINLRVHLPSWN